MATPKIDRTYVVNCLVAGFSPTQIADALRVTPSAITQFLDSDTSIASEVNSKRSSKLSRSATIDDRLDDIEDKAWKLVERNLGMIMDPMKLLKVAMTANSAKRRGSATPSQEAPIGGQVVLNLPQHLHQHFHFDSQNQAVAIGDTPLVTMPATQARELLKNRAQRPQALTQETQDEALSW